MMALSRTDNDIPAPDPDFPMNQRRGEQTLFFGT